MKTLLAAVLRWFCLVLLLLEGTTAAYTIQKYPSQQVLPTIVPLANTNVYLPVVFAGELSWNMVGANPARTSWVPEGISGKLYPVWYKQFEPFVQLKFQIIAANNMLYISSSKGLYAIDANTGAEKWVYPTEMPLGNSPTVQNGVAYVGGLDRRLHAVNALTGQPLWKFTAKAGFDSNPLVVEDKVIAGSRDGAMYAVYASGPLMGKQAWKYQTGGSINYSAAYSAGVVYFASNDSYAYALDASTGSLIWKSAKLPGAGFYSWWPVVYGDWVIFAGSNNYRTTLAPGPTLQFTEMERNDIYPNRFEDPSGTLVGPLGTAPGGWVSGTPTIDTSKPMVTANGSTTAVTQYFEDKPWRRTYFVLNRTTGEEYTSNFDSDAKPEYAPLLWVGTHSGNRYPPVVGVDGVLYQTNNYLLNQYIAGGQISGWQIGTPYISVVSSDWNAVDETLAYAAGGNNIYWKKSCEGDAGAFNIKLPNQVFASRYIAGTRPPTDGYDPNREWKYFDYNLNNLIPGYDTRYDTSWVFGGSNGFYGCIGNQNPPIPYHNKVYTTMFNTLIAFGPSSGQAAALPMARTVNIQDPTIPTPSVDEVRNELAVQVQNLINAGHLRPGYNSTGIFDYSSSRWCGDKLVDYWHHPGDVITTLIRALPHLSPNLQTAARNYLQAEYAAYSPVYITHIGWKSGTAREVFNIPPEVQNDFVNYPPAGVVYGYDGWSFAQHSFYALWKYATVFGGAKAIFDASKNNLEAPPSDTYLSDYPHVLNAYIDGYRGYLELEKLANYPESAQVRSEYNRLLNLRKNNYSKDAPAELFNHLETYYCLALNASRNFIYLTPELADYLRANALVKVQQTLDEYSTLAPYWFISNFDVTLNEGVIHHYYDYHAVFQARALILQESSAQLSKYLDVPAMKTGDLFYIDNLVAVLEAANR